jgi:hypothetical protein
VTTTPTMPATRVRPRAHHLVELEGLRALAAVAVLLTHAGFLSGSTGRATLPGFLARMDIGVAIFFVLSGARQHPVLRHPALCSPRAGLAGGPHRHARPRP